jgi:D-alanyl-D-alanine carboxypeptidase
VKTGTSNMARENLVSAAKTLPQFPPVVYRNVVAVVLGSDNETTTSADRFTDSRTLLDFGLHRTP